MASVALSMFLVQSFCWQSDTLCRSRCGSSGHIVARPTLEIMELVSG